MSVVEIIVLFAVMALLALLPSTSVALVVARSSTAGFINGAAVAVGIVLGDLIFVSLAILGMAALAEMLGGFFLVLRYLAALYLIWFGISLLRAKGAIQVRRNRSVTTLSASVLSGLMITLGDVKAIVFYASLLPAFVDLASISTSDVATVVVLTVVAVGGVKLGYAFAASRFIDIADMFKPQRAVQMTVGGVMVGTGVTLLVKN
jgi:threonine/homoserine/homoserine lactone efflux protein